MADVLLDTVGAKGITQGLPSGAVTWQGRDCESAIDLVFLTEGAHGALARCAVQEGLHHGHRTGMELGTS